MMVVLTHAESRLIHFRDHSRVDGMATCVKRVGDSLHEGGKGDRLADVSGDAERTAFV